MSVIQCTLSVHHNFHSILFFKMPSNKPVHFHIFHPTPCVFLKRLKIKFFDHWLLRLNCKRAINHYVRINLLISIHRLWLNQILWCKKELALFCLKELFLSLDLLHLIEYSGEVFLIWLIVAENCDLKTFRGPPDIKFDASLLGTIIELSCLFFEHFYPHYDECFSAFILNDVDIAAKNLYFRPHVRLIKSIILLEPDRRFFALMDLNRFSRLALVWKDQYLRNFFRSELVYWRMV